jgi:hypothetical protein
MCSLTNGETFPHNRAMSLLEQTQTLLKRTLDAGTSLRQIAEECGGTVNHEWLKKFAAGKIEDPGVSRIESLFKHLSETTQSH